MSTKANDSSKANDKPIEEQIEEVHKALVAENLGWIRSTPGLPLAARWLPLATILLGFSLIVSGGASALSIELPPSVSITLMGALIAFVGTIFVFLYKSRMAEARGYVEELESKTSYWETYVGEPKGGEKPAGQPNERRARLNARLPGERARLKIQYYTHENLRQVRWIFWLTLVAMFLGFFIIIGGAVLAYILAVNSSPSQVPSIVTSLSGVIVEFIAATFLIVYRSTMKQANEYVDILRRLNAIGTSIVLVDEMDDQAKANPTYKDEIRARIASDILLQASSGNEEKARENEE
jgi:membrane protein implicated in regulation of membrane protease activity